MELTLTPELFEDGKYAVRYGVDREALFSIVDEEFQGSNNIGRVNKINILTRTVNADGTTQDALLQSSVIGLGNAIVGVRTSVPELRGKLLSKDNMANTVIILYE